uniref:Uncharacterized protein n=1 Tax=Rhizophora mucronata TaxID=61149 RepID=A0A2P2JP24_RHIMU
MLHAIKESQLDGHNHLNITQSSIQRISFFFFFLHSSHDECENIKDAPLN